MTAKTNKKLTPFEKYQRVKEARQKDARNILKDVLNDNEQFAAVSDSRKKLGRWQRECESYLSDEGLTKHRARIQAKIDKATAELEVLNDRAEIATVSLPEIASHVEAIDESLQALGASLSTNLDNVSFDDESELERIAAEAIEAANFQDLPEITDPYTKYRVARATADTNEEEASSED